MILAPTLLLNAGSGAAIARPTFSRDFAGEKTLDNGTGPAITFTRASNATFFDASGTLQTASNDAPRFDHSGGSSLGLLIEESRTNSIRNSQAGGGSSSTLPTNWMSYTDVGTIAVVGNGTEGGMNYVDVQFSGTNSSGAPQSGFVSADATNAIAALSGQTWSGSWYVKLVAGSLTGAFVGVRAQERKSTTALNSQTQTSFTPTSSYQRVSASRTLTGADTAFVTNEIQVGANTGATIDLTLRIAAPQLEQGAFATSYIPTTTAAATRAADSALVTPISSFYNQSEGTLFAEGTRAAVALGSGFFQRFATISDGTTDNRVDLGSGFADPRIHRFAVSVGGVASAQLDTTSTMVAGTYKLIGAYKVDDFAFYNNAALVGTDSSGTLPTTVNQMMVGGERQIWVRKIAYYPRRLSNSLLQQLTT